MKAVNWNKQDDLTFMYWRQNIAQFWVDTEFKVSKDIKSWNEDLNDKEREAYKKVLAGLTGLDTQQGDKGMPLVSLHTEDMRKQAVYSFMGMMEQIHAKSYSTIFSTLHTKAEIEDIFEWTNNNEFLQFKAKKINEIYQSKDALKMKVASTMLETFLFYSGFFTPLYYLGNNKLANVAEIIKLIIRDESVHGTYTGYKFQQGYNELSEQEQEEMKMWVYNLCLELYQNEVKYTQSIYDQVGWTEKVKVFIRYNANKALQNLGFDPLFPDTAEDVDPIVMNGISTGTSNHDFFSQVGNGYLLGSVEAMDDEDYSKWM